MNGTAVGESSSAARARTGPAPVLTEASIRRKREHSRQASLDMAAREGAVMDGFADDLLSARRQQRRTGYMADTQSSLRRTSVGSDASFTGSVRRNRVRGGEDFNDDDSDVASVASSQWSVRRRRVAPRTAKPMERSLPSTAVDGKTRLADIRRNQAANRDAAKNAGSINPAENENNDQASPTQLQGNAVVVRGGARLPAARTLSVPQNNDNVNQRNGTRRPAPAEGDQDFLTAVIMSDDEAGELTKSGASVSVSPVTSGTRSARKSLQLQQQQQQARGTRNGSADADCATEDMEDTPTTRTQLESMDSPAPGPCASPPAAQARTHARTQSGNRADKTNGRPPLTPRGEAAQGPGQRNGSLGAAQRIPPGKLMSNTVHRPSASMDAAEARAGSRRSSYGDSPSRMRGSFGQGGAAGAATRTHRFGANGRASISDLDGGRKSGGAESLDDTPISVLKARATMEAETNARRGAAQPHVPRLALGDINAQRDQRRAHGSYKVANGSASGTPGSVGSVLSDVTVSPMTDSADPTSRRSGRSHPTDQPRRSARGGGGKEDGGALMATVPAPAVATYNSHGPSPVRASTEETAAGTTPTNEADESALAQGSPVTAVSPVRRKGGKSEASAVARPASAAVSAPVGSHSPSSAPHDGDTGKPTNAPAAGPAHAASPNASRKQRGFEKAETAGKGAEKTSPSAQKGHPAVQSKKESGCCVVM